MPKFSLDINGVDVDAAEGFESWKGPLPPKGSYPAVLKLLQVKQIKGKTDNRISVMVTLATKGDPEREQYHDCPAWGGFNLTDQGVPFINQFLRSIARDEDDFEKVKKAFYNGFITDDKKVNVTKIGTKKINSPDGELPILVSVGHNVYNGTTTAKVVSFLPPDYAIDSDEDAAEEAVEEDDSDEDLDVDVEEDDEDEDEDTADESVFDEEEEDAPTPA